MKAAYLVIIPSLFGVGALAQSNPSPSAIPIEKAEPVLETPSAVESKLFVPAKWMEGPNHRVAAQAANDGLVNTYVLSYEGQEHEVVTTDALLTRIREVYAIYTLRGMSRTNEFTKALANAGRQKIDSVVGLARNPFGTLKRVPLGASRFFGRVGESVKGGGSEGEGNILQRISGVDKAKVALAAKLGVSPYSTNQELQEQLNNTARAMAGGGFVVSAASAVVGGPAGQVLTIVNVNQSLQQTLVNSSPADLRILNRKKLFALGVAPDDAEEFLMHPWYSPWHETIIVDALDKIGADPTAFLAQACRALTEQDATYFQQLAQVMARYHSKKTPLKSLQAEGRTVCALDANGTLLIPLSCDYAIWGERASTRVGDFLKLAQGRTEIKGLALWVDGKVSDRAAEELKKQQIDLATDVLAKE